MLVSLEILEELTHQNFSISSLKALVQSGCSVGQPTLLGRTTNWSKLITLLVVSHLAGRDSLTWKSGISRVTKKCKCVTDKEILLCRYVLFFSHYLCRQNHHPSEIISTVQNSLFAVQAFQDIRGPCHDSNMARHLYHQLCFLWPFQDSSVATSPGRFV